VGADAFLGLHHLLVQQLGQQDAAVEQPRAVLVGDAQRVAKPRVVTSSVGSPLRSSSALVATVVPIFTHSTCAGVMASPGARPSRRRMPSTAASRYCSGFSLSSLAVTRVPSGFAVCRPRR
jgi:hypothetical protein